MSFELKLPLSIPQALLLDTEDWNELGSADLTLTDAERDRVCRLWLHLRGIEDPASPEGVLAWREVRNDSPLILALSAPGSGFLNWFRVQTWEDFNASDETGSVEWAWGVLDRARALIKDRAWHCSSH